MGADPSECTREGLVLGGWAGVCERALDRAHAPRRIAARRLPAQRRLEDVGVGRHRRRGGEGRSVARLRSEAGVETTSRLPASPGWGGVERAALRGGRERCGCGGVWGARVRPPRSDDITAVVVRLDGRTPPGSSAGSARSVARSALGSPASPISPPAPTRLPGATGRQDRGLFDRAAAAGPGLFDAGNSRGFGAPRGARRSLGATGERQKLPGGLGTGKAGQLSLGNSGPLLRAPEMLPPAGRRSHGR